MAPQLATVCCRIKRYHSGSPQDRRFSVAEYDRLLSALNGVAGMTSTSVPPDKQVLQTLKWRWEESERAGMALKRMSDAKYHEARSMPHNVNHVHIFVPACVGS